MAEITRQDGQELTEAERLRVLMGLGMSAEYARFVLAMQRGEVEGDLVEVGADEEIVEDDE